MIKQAVRHHARDLLAFIDQSPSPWHAVHIMRSRLLEAGFVELEEADQWALTSGSHYFVIRDESSIIAFSLGAKGLPEVGFNIVGAHTDSPGLRVKPLAEHSKSRTVRLGVEVYGGPLLATFTDRDLSLAGRVALRGDPRPTSRLVHFDRSLLRIPNLAIHMNRGVNEQGLALDKTSQLPPILAVARDSLPQKEQLVSLIAGTLDVKPEEILSWELNVFDTQPGAFFGTEDEFIANSQLDNLASCHAALSALIEAAGQFRQGTRVCAFFDHEEVGSTSAKGANGSFLADTLERIALSLSLDRSEFKRALSRSFLISADMAHAYHPGHPSAYDPEHHVFINQGPVIKTNAQARYTTESLSEARFRQLCERVDVPCQRYVHRTDIPCGSTIGPMASAMLGVRSIDVGCPQWAMHSIRESAGTLDHTYMTQVLGAFFAE